MAMAQRAKLLPTVLLLLPHSAGGALSVLPHQSDSIVLQLRQAITLDEKDLLGPLPPSACSSLSDGPFCAGLAGRLAADRPAERGEAPSFMSFGDMGDGSAQFVVDGVLSNWMQSQNKEAFAWPPDTVRTFSNLVSRVISESLSAGQESPRMEGSKRPSMAKTGSQCFRLALDRLPPGLRYVPEDFSAGLPEAIAASWQGTWEAAAGRRSRPRQPSGSEEVGLRPPWSARAVLRSALGYLFFREPLVIRRLLIGVPPLAEVGENWGRGSLICGRLQGREQWCAALHQVVAAARQAAADGDGQEEPAFVDVGDSIHAVDEVAFIAAPENGLTLGLVEVMATLPEHPLHGLPMSRRVVLLRPARGQEQGPVVEPTLTTISRDAAVWDMNEVMQHQMLLRTPSSRRPAVAAAVTSRPEGAMQRELQSFQEMLHGLKAGKIPPPRGVTFRQLREEVATLVASTKEIQDDDVLLHSNSESLLQQRLREKGLDGLLALQAAWRLAGEAGKTVAAGQEAPAAEPVAAAAAAEGDGWEQDAAEAAEALERRAAEVLEKQKQKGLDLKRDLEEKTTVLAALQELQAQLQNTRNELVDKLRSLTGQLKPGEGSSERPPRESRHRRRKGEEPAAAAAEEVEAGAAASEAEEAPGGDAGAGAADEAATDGVVWEGGLGGLEATKMADIVAAALKQASGDQPVEAAIADEGVQGAMQEAMQGAMEEALNLQPGAAENMKVHFVKLEDLQNGEDGAGVAQALAALLGKGGGGAGGGVATIDLQSVLRAQQERAAGQDADSEEAPAEGVVEI